MGRKSKRLHAPGNNARAAINRPGSMKKYDKAGIYARLSADHDTRKNESVETQIEIAKKFVEDWNQSHKDRIEVMHCYVDRGKTGTNFERDAFQRLMQDIRLGEINCVIVKDLSRFGRNYLEAGNYIEKIFPFLGVRFVAVVDGYDTGAEGNNARQMTSEIKNLVNDMYAKDSSVKAKQQLKQRRETGSYVGGPPPYGYIAVFDGKIRKLAPDENTADIVRCIYNKFIETGSYKAVADHLNMRKINPPYIYGKRKEVYCPLGETYKGWNLSAVERMIKSEIYIGDLVQGRTAITGRSEKNRIRKGEEEWVRKENSHEPLISRDVYEQARKVRLHIKEKAGAKKHPTEGCPIEENIFEGLLFCGVCGRKMTRSSYAKSDAKENADGRKERREGYFCMNGGSTKVESCPQSNRISKQELMDLLFALFEVEFAAQLKKQKNYVEKGQFLIRQKQRELEEKNRQLERHIAGLKEEESRSYIEYRMGNMSQQEYVSFKMQKKEWFREPDQRKRQLQDAGKALEYNGAAFLKAIRALVRFQNREELTRDFMELFIDRIYIYPGKRVEVLFAYSDTYA